MTGKSILVAALTSTLALVGTARGESESVVKPEVLARVQSGRALAGPYSPVGQRLCNSVVPNRFKEVLPSVAELQARGGTPGQPPQPAKIFDNLYYLGIRHVSAWAVNTSSGIILIDALDNATEATEAIEGGLRKVGLDPANIKYIIVTHGHGDHYGGAQYLVDKYKAHVLMSDIDWKYMAQRFGNGRGPASWGPPPKRDMVMADGEKFTFGGETITAYVTPGHTPGTLSLLIPVTDHGQPHMVALWGGTGFNFPPSQENFKAYADSAERFSGLAAAAGADTPLSNHPETDSAIVKIDELKKRGTNDPNPFVLGRNITQNFMMAFSECARAHEMTY